MTRKVYESRLGGAAMGAWGPGAFENDDAIDWVAEVIGSGDDAIIRAAVESVANRRDGDYIQAPDASVAVAAGEVVAAAIGAPGQGLPPELTAWVRARAHDVTPETVRKAHDAVTRVATDSELRELWDDSESPQEWRAAVADLQRRLAGGAAQQEDVGRL